MKFTTSLVLTFSLSLGLISPAYAYTGLGKNSVDAATLKRYAPPALDPAIARQIEAILDVRSPGLGFLTPNGKKLFFGWAATGSSQVWRIDGAQRFPVQVTGGQDSTSMVGITPDGQYLLLSRDRQGEENAGLYLQSTQGGAVQEIQHQPKVKTSLQYIADDSRTIYFSANDLRPDSYAIYRYDLQTKQKTLILAESGVWWIADALPNGKFLFGKATGSQSREYYEFDETTKQLTPVLGQGEKEDYRAEFGAHPGELLVLTSKFDEFRRLYRYIKDPVKDSAKDSTKDPVKDPVRGKFSPITPAMPMDISSFDIDTTKQRILYTVNDRGYSRLEAIDARTFQPIPLPQFPQANQVYAGTTTHDGRFTTIGVETAKAPRTSYVYDWSTQTLTQWVLPSTPEIDPNEFVAGTLESYPARDGTQIPMFVYRPKQCPQTCPAIVHFHGGPEAQSKAGFNRLAQIYVKAGFIYVEPNVRGSEGYGKTWLNADNGAKRLEVITDIEDAALYIRANWQVNGKPPKIGVMGGSYGGYSALMAMTKFAGSYDAGVSIVGMSNLLTFLQNTAAARRLLRTSEYGDPDRDRAALIALSPITYVDRVKSPLLIVQGANDPRVPVGEAVQMQAALEKRQIPSQLIVFPDEGHGAGKRSNQVLEIGHTLRFFQQHLQ
ncbi:prolyl oligopeptidase family serine peptidase [Tumidithrix elongata RA019]|uniref:Prolyl oligopeptidase family serine peptidase n=1 Tax=Tumidithrix elongata BACA0141 TaxID=2716417 RepID=A0AAW9Q093_9CYAN|nr:prolyl oligopeptidase family serine peptidase [Tumidithrix elongata RA019]